MQLTLREVEPGVIHFAVGQMDGAPPLSSEAPIAGDAV